MKKIFKKIVIPLTALMLVFIPLTVMAHADHGDEHSLSTEDVLAEILQSQNIKVIQDIDCQKITDEQFESLGDAVMEQMHPGQAHEAMDQMMAPLRQGSEGQGGEGSEQLRAMHIMMGRSYLDCVSNTEGMPAPHQAEGFGAGMGGNMMSGGMGMMGGGMMSDFPSKVGVGFSYDFGWIFMILFWILVVLGIIWLFKLLVGKNTSQGKMPEVLEILKSRYAKGEITKEEFEKIKKDIS